mgnify:CR=1 FL=1
MYNVSTAHSSTAASLPLPLPLPSLQRLTAAPSTSRVFSAKDGLLTPGPPGGGTCTLGRMPGSSSNTCAFVKSTKKTLHVVFVCLCVRMCVRVCVDDGWREGCVGSGHD